MTRAEMAAIVTAPNPIRQARRRQSVARATLAMLLLAAVLAAVAAGMRMADLSLQAALAALLRGAFGSWSAITAGTLVRATPLMFAGLAVAIAFRAGIFNIGAEGQLLAGAAAATAVALVLPSFPGGWVVAIGAGATAGALWASVAGVLRARFGVLEVNSTILLNFVALYLVGYLVQGPLQEVTGIYPQSDAIPAIARAPMLPGASGLHAGFIVAVLACAFAWWYLRHTAGGFRLRATGANAGAAAIAGRIDVGRVAFLAFAASGALAGAGGAFEVSGVTYALYPNISPGYGFTAIAVALVANLNPLAVIGTAILFGALEAGATAMQRDAGVPAAFVSVLEAAIILAVLIVRRHAVLPGIGAGTGAAAR